MATKVKQQACDVDIVIPVHGQFDYLKKCIDALPVAFEGYTIRVIAVDDASPEPLTRVWPDIIGNKSGRLLVNPERRGFAATCNAGAQAGWSPYVLFLNSDCILQPKCGTILIETIKSKEHGNFGIVAPLLLFPEDSRDMQRPAGKVQHAGVVFDLNGSPAHVFVGWNPDNPKVKIKRKHQAVTGACVLTTREVIGKVGDLIRKFDKKFKQGSFFQEDYGLGTWEDLDACFTVRALGYEVVFDPEAVAYHHTGASAQASNTPFPLQRNESIFRARWGQSIQWDEYMYV